MLLLRQNTVLGQFCHKCLLYRIIAMRHGVAPCWKASVLLIKMHLIIQAVRVMRQSRRVEACAFFACTGSRWQENDMLPGFFHIDHLHTVIGSNGVSRPAAVKPRALYRRTGQAQQAGTVCIPAYLLLRYLPLGACADGRTQTCICTVRSPIRAPDQFGYVRISMIFLHGGLRVCHCIYAHTSCISIPQQAFSCFFFSRYILSRCVASLFASYTV